MIGCNSGKVDLLQERLISEINRVWARRARQRRRRELMAVIAQKVAAYIKEGRK